MNGENPINPKLISRLIFHTWMKILFNREYVHYKVYKTTSSTPSVEHCIGNRKPFCTSAEENCWSPVDNQACVSTGQLWGGKKYTLTGQTQTSLVLCTQATDLSTFANAVQLFPLKFSFCFVIFLMYSLWSKAKAVLDNILAKRFIFMCSLLCLHKYLQCC